MRLKIIFAPKVEGEEPEERIYAVSDIDSIVLKDILVFNEQAEALGTKYRWADVERIFKDCASLTEDELQEHPDKWLIPSVLVWSARRRAGEDVTLDEALDISPARIIQLDTPKKVKAGKAKGGKKKKAPNATPPSAQDSVVEPDELAAQIPTT